jgi:hypothetical protein
MLPKPPKKKPRLAGLLCLEGKSHILIAIANITAADSTAITPFLILILSSEGLWAMIVSTDLFPVVIIVPTTEKIVDLIVIVVGTIIEEPIMRRVEKPAIMVGATMSPASYKCTALGLKLRLKLELQWLSLSVQGNRGS